MPIQDLTPQLRTRLSRVERAVGWFVIIATTTVGTTLADLLDRSLGIGYLGGSTALLALLLVTLGLWHRTLGSVSIDSITSRRAESFYWATILFSQTLGTALGDWLADSKTGLGLGYEGGALVFAGDLQNTDCGRYLNSGHCGVLRVRPRTARLEPPRNVPQIVV